MAIDVLSREGCIPIIVGDEEDMANVVGVSTGGAGGIVNLLMTSPDGKTQKQPLSPQASKNFGKQEYVLLVSLTAEDEISAAYLSPVDNADKPMRMLEEPEIKKLAEDLVGGNFTLDFLR
jgi:hypothetical protein